MVNSFCVIVFCLALAFQSDQIKLSSQKLSGYKPLQTASKISREFFPQNGVKYTHSALQNDFKRLIHARLSKLVLFKSMGNIQSVCVKIGQVKNNLFPAFAKKSMIIFEAVNMQIMVL